MTSFEFHALLLSRRSFIPSEYKTRSYTLPSAFNLSSSSSPRIPFLRGDYPPPPRPEFHSYGDYPPPPQPTYSSYGEHRPVYPPQEHYRSGSHYSPVPEASPGYVHHEPHVSPPVGEEERHHFRPHIPNFIESHIHSHGHQSESSGGPDLSTKPFVKVYCKSETNYMLVVRDGKVILARADPIVLTQH